MMKKGKCFFLLTLAFILGLFAALLKRPSPPSGPAIQAQQEGVLPEGSKQEAGVAAIRQDSRSSSPALPDLQGMSVGTGKVLAEVPQPRVDLQRLGEDFSAPPAEREDDLVWPKTSGKLKKIEDQVKEIRDEIDEVTLDTVSRALNSLPFVSAEPEDAEWHISGGEIGLEITIPVEDLKIGPKGQSDN